jgi:hypothetical protein
MRWGAGAITRCGPGSDSEDFGSLRDVQHRYICKNDKYKVLCYLFAFNNKSFPVINHWRSRIKIFSTGAGAETAYKRCGSATHKVCKVGWVDFGTIDKSTPEDCYLPFKSNKNKQKKCFDPVTASSLAKTFWVMHYIEVNIFFHNQKTQNFL